MSMSLIKTGLAEVRWFPVTTLAKLGAAEGMIVGKVLFELIGRSFLFVFYLFRASWYTLQVRSLALWFPVQFLHLKSIDDAEHGVPTWF
jgi:hypothetical protein